MKLEVLSPAASKRKAELESVVTQGIKTFIEVGEALAAIREEKLYVDEFDTWEKYVAAKWNFSKRRADQLIAGTSVAKKLGNIVPIATESVAREFVKIPRKHRVKVAKEVVKIAKAKNIKNRKPSVEARDVRHAAMKVKARGGLAAAKADSEAKRQPEFELNEKAKLTPIAKAAAYALISEWFDAKKKNLESPPMATPSQVVTQILRLFC